MERIQVGNKASGSVSLSIFGGVTIIIGALSLVAMLRWHSATLMMGGVGHMFTIVYPYWLTGIMIAIALLTGGIVIMAAYKMYREPENQRKLGFLVLIGSIIGLVSIGGFGLGGIIGIIGGSMALSGRL